MMPFRKIIYMAVNNGLLQRDPFFSYSITKEETKRGFLTKDEIRILIDGTFKKPSYTLIRDLFIFCTFTGLSWTDISLNSPTPQLTNIRTDQCAYAARIIRLLVGLFLLTFGCSAQWSYIGFYDKKIPVV